jgi:hypothetical protein
LDAAERAVGLDPGDAEAHAALGSRLASVGEIARGKAAYDNALRLYAGLPGAASVTKPALRSMRR